MTKHTLRKMTMRDYAAVAALWRTTPGIGLDDDCDSRAGIARYFKRNPGLSFVAVADGQVVGAVLCGHDGRRGFLHHLAVDSAHRKCGLGKRLVDACLKALRRCDIVKCSIFLFKSNASGRAFWRHNGWTVRKDLTIMQKPTNRV